MADNLQTIIASNIAALRKSRGFTQAELAERLGYSDKSVSKWERGDGLPDVLCLKAMADLFGVSMDYMLEAEHEASEAASGSAPGNAPSPPAGVYRINHRNIAAVSVAGVWLLAALVFVVGLIAGRPLVTAFFIAIPVSAILLTVFSSLWGTRTHLFLSVTLLVWGVLLLVCWVLRDRDPWLLLSLGLPGTAVVWLSCRVTTKIKPESAAEDDNFQDSPPSA